MLHKLRSGLTTLGLMFGVAAVISMLAVGEGASRDRPARSRGAWRDQHHYSLRQALGRGPGCYRPAGTTHPPLRSDVRRLSSRR